MSTYMDAAKGKPFVLERLELPSFVKEFLAFLIAERNLSPRTALNYAVWTGAYIRWLSVRAKGISPTRESVKSEKIENASFALIEDVTAEDIRSYIVFLSGELGNAASSRASKIAALHALYAYFCVVKKKLGADPTRELSVPKLEKRLPRYLTLEECRSLLESVNTEGKERDYCIITLLLSCGMRLSELVGINIGDIRSDRSLLLRGKGRKERIVYLTDACVESIDRYVGERRTKRTDPLFIGRGGERLTGRRVEQIVKEALIHAGIRREGLSPHKLRHSAATLMYEGGADVLQLREILGHAHTATTEIYTHLSTEQVREAMMGSPLHKKPGTRHSEPQNSVPEDPDGSEVCS